MTTEHTIFGSSSPGSLNTDDNDPSGHVWANRATAIPTGWRLVGVRVWCPSGVTICPAQFVAWSTVPSTPNTTTADRRTGTITPSGGSKWAEGRFDEPLEITSETQFLVGMVKMGSGANPYNFTGSTYKSADDNLSITGTDGFNWGPGQSLEQFDVYWGYDVIVDEGPDATPGEGSASVAWQASASAHGTPPAVPMRDGDATASWTAGVTANGIAPAVPVNQGSAETVWAAVATATGSGPLIPVATGTAATGWTADATATGASPTVGINTGTASANWAATTTASGDAPSIPASTGTATTTWAATATARGNAPKPERDIQILATTVPTTGWDTNGPATAWTTGDPNHQTIETTEPTSAWATAEPSH